MTYTIKNVNTNKLFAKNWKQTGNVWINPNDANDKTMFENTREAIIEYGKCLNEFKEMCINDDYIIYAIEKCIV